MALFGLASATIVAMILVARSSRTPHTVAVLLLWLALAVGTVLGVF